MAYRPEYLPVYNPSLTVILPGEATPVLPNHNQSILEWLKESGRLIEWTEEEIESDRIPLKSPEAEWDDLMTSEEEEEELGEE